VTAHEFVAAACGGPIEGYSEEEKVRKVAWLKAGAQLMRKLAKELGLEKGTYNARINPAGPACSGDIHLHGDWIYVALEQGGIAGQFMWRYCDGQNDYTGHPNRWAYWPELLELEDFANKIKAGRPRG